MAQYIHRTASSLLVLAYVLTAAFQGGPITAIVVAMYCLLPLACIWFPEEMGTLAYVRGLPLSETPGCLVTAGGWLLLLLPLILALVRSFQGA